MKVVIDETEYMQLLHIMTNNSNTISKILEIVEELTKRLEALESAQEITTESVRLNSGRFLDLEEKMNLIMEKEAIYQVNLNKIDYKIDNLFGEKIKNLEEQLHKAHKRLMKL